MQQNFDHLILAAYGISLKKLIRVQQINSTMEDVLGFSEGSAIRVTKSTFNSDVNFSDDSGESAFEEVEFVNRIIRRLWPDIRIWLSKLVKALEPVIRKVDLIAGLNLEMIKVIGQFKFRRIDFGDIVSLSL